MSLKIVFMGTPQFAVPSLQAIKDSSHDVVGIVTSPDRRGGRGRKELLLSDVKKHVLDWDVPILQPTNLKDLEFQKQLADLGADLQVVVAFRMLPVSVWDMPPLGTINLHASLLPDYRGAAPINWAIINGETETGLTTFQLQHAIDTGDLLMQERIPIYKEDNAEKLRDRLMLAGPSLLVRTLDMIDSGKIQGKQQAEPNPGKIAPKLNLDNTRINWHNTCKGTYNFIRGLAPYPAAWTVLNDLRLKIYQAEIHEEHVNKDGVPGSVVVRRNEMLVKCTDNYIKLLEVQLEGKKRMGIADFLNGYTDDITLLE